VREANPEVPWRQIIALRNVVIHEYFGVDLELVWAIVTEQIAPLGSQLRSIADAPTR
jgi:uncharacterized protein with HEPN domain